MYFFTEESDTDKYEYTQEEIEQVDKGYDSFIEEYRELCKKYGIGLASDDPYCGLEVVSLREAFLFEEDDEA